MQFVALLTDLAVLHILLRAGSASHIEFKEYLLERLPGLALQWVLGLRGVRIAFRLWGVVQVWVIMRVCTDSMGSLVDSQSSTTWAQNASTKA